jgi:hypothetical protein
MSLVLAVASSAVPVAEPSPTVVESLGQEVAGTWNISLQGHQIALVLEQQETTVSGTLMMMKVDVPMTGTFKGGALSLTGSTESDASGHLSGMVSVDATLAEDGTLSGTLATGRGKITFTAERLKRRPTP